MPPRAEKAGAASARGTRKTRRDTTGEREAGSGTETETCAASGALVGRRVWLGLGLDDIQIY